MTKNVMENQGFNITKPIFYKHLTHDPIFWHFPGSGPATSKTVFDDFYGWYEPVHAILHIHINDVVT